MELGFGSLWLEAGVGSEADDQLEPRARVSVWPGRPNVPGIVAPEPWGARGAECLPADVGDRPADERLDADRGEGAVGQAEALVEPVEHHHPAERSG